MENSIMSINSYFSCQPTTCTSINIKLISAKMMFKGNLFLYTKHYISLITKQFIVFQVLHLNFSIVIDLS